jgi:hypothetical protein
MWVGAWPNCEGAFIGVDVLKSLQAAADNSSLDTSASPPLVPEDRIMQDGTWERVLASRETEREALDALRGGDLGKAKNLAVRDISLNGSFYFGHELLGRALLKSGEKSAGTLELNEALKLDPPYAKRRIDIQGLLK